MLFAVCDDLFILRQHLPNDDLFILFKKLCCSNSVVEMQNPLW